MKEEIPSSKTWDTGASKILTIQLIFVLAVGWFFYFYQGLLTAQAAFYGGSIAMLNVWLMSRWIRHANKIAELAPGQEVNVLYLAAVQRFVLTLGFFALGMGAIDLPPIPMLIAFATAQFVYFFKGRS